MKTCTRCGEPKALEEFHKNRNTPDGRTTACKVCACAAKAVDRAARPEVHLQQQREFRQRQTPEWRARQAEKSREWRKANPERFRAATEAWRQANREAIVKPRARASAKRRYHANPEAFRARLKVYRTAHAAKLSAARCVRSRTERAMLRSRANSAIRRARKRAATVGMVDLRAIYERDGGHCHICERPVPLERTHFDHVIPLAKGGAHSMENIRAACRSCNDRKLHRLLTPELRDEIAREVRVLPPLVPNHRLNLLVQAAA
jgi:5-methylcytosine-specific restriction endonuclease McrA